MYYIKFGIDFYLYIYKCSKMSCVFLCWIFFVVLLGFVIKMIKGL